MSGESESECRASKFSLEESNRFTATGQVLWHLLCQRRWRKPHRSDVQSRSRQNPLKGRAKKEKAKAKRKHRRSPFAFLLGAGWPFIRQLKESTAGSRRLGTTIRK